MKITPELQEAAVSYCLTPVGDSMAMNLGKRDGFVAGAQWAYERGRAEEREKLIRLMRSARTDRGTEIPSWLASEWIDWLESKLAALDAKTPEVEE